MVHYRNLWNLSNGNTWPFYVHTTAVIMHGRPDVTLVGSAAHYVSRLVLSLPMINVCGIDTSATIQSYNTIVVHHLPFLLSVIWYDRREYRLFSSLSAFLLSLNRCNESLIIIHTFLCSCYIELREFHIWLVCIWSKTQNSTQGCIMRQIHTIAVATVWSY